jgi:hypothetical protein
MLQTQCPGCKNVLRIPADLVDQSLRCKHCQMIFTVSKKAAPAIAVPPLQPHPAHPALPQPGVGEFVSHRQRRRLPYELIGSLVAIVAITVAYWILARGGAPRASSTVGHLLGIAGFVMMLATETLYSLRKRLPKFHLGRMSTWLQWHIFMGIVGPYLVLLHTGWKFHGLAGVLTLLVVVMVVSGFIGRYIYTAVPRTLDGAEIAVRELEARIAAADRQLEAQGIPGLAREMVLTAEPVAGWRLVFGRTWLCWRQRRRWRRLLENLDADSRARAVSLGNLLADRYRWHLQIESLAASRRLLAWWHVIHIPLGVVVFTLAFIHIGAALYFATLLK